MSCRKQQASRTTSYQSMTIGPPNKMLSRTDPGQGVRSRKRFSHDANDDNGSLDFLYRFGSGHIITVGMPSVYLATATPPGRHIRLRRCCFRLDPDCFHVDPRPCHLGHSDPIADARRRQSAANPRSWKEARPISRCRRHRPRLEYKTALN